MTPRQLQILVAVSIPAFFAVIVIAALHTPSGSRHDTPAPAAISRDDLVSRYLELAPDPDATASDVVDLAEMACDRLSAGATPDGLAHELADSYHGINRARSVMRVLVSYGCPEQLGLF